MLEVTHIVSSLLEVQNPDFAGSKAHVLKGGLTYNEDPFSYKFNLSSLVISK